MWFAVVVVALAACGRAAPPDDDPTLPGVAHPSVLLAARLAAAGTGPARYTNRLALETSPYLLAHAHEPINWQAWGDAPFERAHREGKLVLVSIGYSTCHWCHVMAREVFDDEEVARYLNENFVCIKVDREERPDVDAAYMSAIQAMTGDGGWPLTMFADADRRPFAGGTYIPRDRFLVMARAIRDLQRTDPSALAGDAERVVAALQRDTAGMRGGVPATQAIEAAVRALATRFDETWGGFSRAPKFPSPTSLDLLLRYHRRTGDADALRMVTVTLDRMAAGGIHDQLGGGFHRYSTDAEWHVPHFEKMLYDQAQLAVVYADAAQLAGRADFADVARDTLDFTLRELQAPGGGFYSALDADSATPDGREEEGVFYTWTRAQLDAALGPELATAAADSYGVSAAPSVLHVVHAAEPRARELLRGARAHRIPPRVDTKIVAAWNGLAISAFARASIALDRPDYAVAAERAADMLVGHMVRDDGVLARSFAGGVLGPPGVLEDHVFAITGLLDLFDADGDPRWLDAALALQRVIDRDFAAPAGGYYATANGRDVLARDRPFVDGPLPAANAAAIANLVELATITGDDTWRTRADAGLAAFSAGITRSGAAAPRLLAALEAESDRPLEIALIAPHDPAELAPLAAALRRVYLPNRALVRVVDGAPLVALARHMPWLEAKHALAGKPTAFVCEHAACKLPTSDPDELERQLRAVAPLVVSTPAP
jgi:uncharacterized protein YyaL (SSP411 family)